MRIVVGGLELITEFDFKLSLYTNTAGEAFSLVYLPQLAHSCDDTSCLASFAFLDLSRSLLCHNFLPSVNFLASSIASMNLTLSIPATVDIRSGCTTKSGDMPHENALIIVYLSHGMQQLIGDAKELQDIVDNLDLKPEVMKQPERVKSTVHHSVVFKGRVLLTNVFVVGTIVDRPLQLPETEEPVENCVEPGVRIVNILFRFRKSGKCPVRDTEDENSDKIKRYSTCEQGRDETRDANARKRNANPVREECLAVVPLLRLRAKDEINDKTFEDVEVLVSVMDNLEMGQLPIRQNLGSLTCLDLLDPNYPGRLSQKLPS
ncbi:unnamed protein product [Thlaspi arvense]|uniref:Uncharacterized protein n=1 Tax=Thlaspi arvense TaxID=13288 RepID=A0AAU9RN74_THLAR|nr:unnamed protein product [Thlaspi arvense]